MINEWVCRVALGLDFIILVLRFDTIGGGKGKFMCC